MKSAGHLVVGLNAQQGLLFGLAMLVAVGAIAAARIGASRQPTPGFTQLWILPADRPDPNIVRLGVSSGETAIMKYRLELKIGSSVVGEWMPIVKPGERWEATTVLPEQRSDGETVEAVLYRLDAPDTIYRRVVLWRDYQGVSK